MKSSIIKTGDVESIIRNVPYGYRNPLKTIHTDAFRTLISEEELKSFSNITPIQ